MARCLIGMLIGFFVGAGGWSVAADEDQILVKLNRAKTAYESDREQYRDAVNKYFDKREDGARTQGNKKLVDQIKAERSAFLQYGDLPSNAPAELRRRLQSARTSMESAYAAAIRDYTKSKKDNEANAIERELEQFKRDGDATWIELFNGKDLKGWHATIGRNENWRVANGILIGNGDSFLTTDRKDFENFRLRIEGMLAEGADSGVFFRGQDKSDLAYEANIAGTYPGAGKTGSIGLSRPPEGRVIGAAQNPSTPGRWFSMEVLAQRNQFTVWVDGKQVVQCEDTNRTYSRGVISLQSTGGPKTGGVMFRKVEIKELPKN